MASYAEAKKPTPALRYRLYAKQSLSQSGLSHTAIIPATRRLLFWAILMFVDGR